MHMRTQKGTRPLEGAQEGAPGGRRYGEMHMRMQKGMRLLEGAQEGAPGGRGDRGQGVGPGTGTPWRPQEGLAFDDKRGARRQTLAFNAFKDSCPSLTEKRVELCKGVDWRP